MFYKTTCINCKNNCFVRLMEGTFVIRWVKCFLPRKKHEKDKLKKPKILTFVNLTEAEFWLTARMSHLVTKCLIQTKSNWIFFRYYMPQTWWTLPNVLSQLTDESLYFQFLEVVLLSGNLTKCKVFTSAVQFCLRYVQYHTLLNRLWVFRIGWCRK